MMKKITLLAALFAGMFLTAITFASTYPLPSSPNDIVGDVNLIKTGFTTNIVDVMHRYDMGFYELVEANPGIDLKRLGFKETLLIPSRFILPQSPRRGLVVNLAEMRVYYYRPNYHNVMTFPIGIGKPGWRTPLLRTRILDKETNPAWIPTQETRDDFLKQNGYPLPDIVASGPENPLGYYAMRFAKWNFMIHGTIEPEGVGQRVSGGCLRMQNKDIKTLFGVVKIGLPVTIIYEPYKAGWEGNTLYLEVHRPIKNYPLRSYKKAIARALKERPGVKVAVDWRDVREVVSLQMGVPAPIGHVVA